MRRTAGNHQRPGGQEGAPPDKGIKPVLASAFVMNMTEPVINKSEQDLAAWIVLERTTLSARRRGSSGP
jgi:hypothetical protein